MACNCNEGFSENFLFLKHKEASFMELLHLLFSSDLEKRNFVELHRNSKKVADHHYRLVIFVSVFIQKILHLSAKPMSWAGSVYEQWLNLLLCNGGFIKFICNLITGSVEMPPEKSSATFTSYIGNLDTRLDLDKSIKYGDSRYCGALSMMASKIAYENEAFIQNVVTDNWKMKFLGFYNFWNDYEGKETTQAFMFQDKETNPDIIMVAFRGTEPFNADDWITDIDMSWYELEGVGKVHGGFMKALGLQKELGWPKKLKLGENKASVAYYSIRESLEDLLRKNEQAKFIVTGHSLGGALAILFPLVLSLHDETWLLEKLEGVYTFGQPRVGDQRLGEYMNKRFKVHTVKYLRFVYCNDIVPRLPYDDSILLFKHFGTCFCYNSFYDGKIVKEEPNKNYFSIVDAIPNHFNAMWELIRSFIIPFMKGPDYAEGWTLRILRFLGLFIPGIVAHGPQDYVNSTRLCTSVPSLPTQQGLNREKRIEY